jgi:hypothetical protein
MRRATSLYSQFRFQLRRGDRIVRRIDDYPELSQALRAGDLPTARVLCARLFDLRCEAHRPAASKGK